MEFWNLKSGAIPIKVRDRSIIVECFITLRFYPDSSRISNAEKPPADTLEGSGFSGLLSQVVVFLCKGTPKLGITSKTPGELSTR